MRRRDGAPVDIAVLQRMAAQVRHRGPDADGLWVDGDVGFGHRRLAIIDVSGSPQPMGDASGTLQVCFNGEIFNYRELRHELADYPFRTNGDTEVLLALFARAGWRGVERLDGQFAYALHDARSGELWLFRDRLGILPLYHCWDGPTFLFASEIKALLTAHSEGPGVDDDSLMSYLAHRSVPAPNTLFRGIRKLPPGHWLRVDRSGRVDSGAYWRLPSAPASVRIQRAAAVDQVAAALERSVTRRLVADVPVGAYLSGGVDSSLIVALMAKARDGGMVETFSAGFEHPSYDERPFAREVSRRLGTVHHEVVVRPEDFLDLWNKLTWHRDGPLSEPADVALFRLAAAARASVKVLLSGEGSDELFAGYPKYRFARLAGLADWLPARLRGPLFHSIERLLPANAAKLRIMARAMSAASEAGRFQSWFAPFTAYERRQMLSVPDYEGHVEIWRRAQGDVLQRMLYVDCHTWLADNLLERGDRMSMAASVESRPPFMDHHLVELAFRLPSRLKVRHGSTKWLVKEVARRFLPADIVDRPKVGFRVPLSVWFRGHLRELLGDLLLAPGSFVGQRLDRAFVRDLVQSHDQGRRNEEIRLWTLLGLEIWYDVFFKRRPTSVDEPLLCNAQTAAPAGGERQTRLR
jgi:asparagine synthase (glutamine-hydrolysing)